MSLNEPWAFALAALIAALGIGLEVRLRLRQARRRKKREELYGGERQKGGGA